LRRFSSWPPLPCPWALLGPNVKSIRHRPGLRPR
jgi:hypothetical protein